MLRYLLQAFYGGGQLSRSTRHRLPKGGTEAIAGKQIIMAVIRPRGTSAIAHTTVLDGWVGLSAADVTTGVAGVVDSNGDSKDPLTGAMLDTRRS